ncbi:MAG: toll/interleukin-1 receptor domain-containing protein [Terriglobia bacterium]
MKRIFITYSHQDDEFVTELVNQLDFAGLDVARDKRVLKPGDSMLRIFEEIGGSGFLVPVLSSNSITSNWVKKELGVAIVKEIDEEGFRVVPIVKPGEDWDRLHREMPTDLREALRDKIIARFDTEPRQEAIKGLLRAFSDEEDAAGLYAKVLGRQSDNPFRRVRTEYFEDLQQIARCFAEPESVTYDRIVEVKPTLVEGGRGSGKTMILKSLVTRVSVYRRKASSFAQAQLRHFGAYCRLSQGAFATQEKFTLKHIPEDAASRLFSSELILRLIQSLVEELDESQKQAVITINADQERKLARNISLQIRPSQPEGEIPGDIQSLKDLIERELRLISDYVGRRVLEEKPAYEGIFLGRSELAQVCSSLCTSLPVLGAATVYFLLDEYENLLPFQKIVVNTLLKWSASGTFTMKIATKKTGFRNPQTLEGQELEESHDYALLDLDYDISNNEHRKHYKNFLKQICIRILHGNKLKTDDIQELLENTDRYEDVDGSEVEKLIASTAKDQSGKDWETLDVKEKAEFTHRLEIAALYRLLKKRKSFAGFDDFVLLSSGIVRYFLELCAMSYYFAIRGCGQQAEIAKIGVKHQTDAAYALSSYYLGTIGKNIANHGARIQQLAIDLGDIFRLKLFSHPSEPEAARLSITDPHLLGEKIYEELMQILDTAEMHSVLQVPRGRGGMRPKHAADVQPREYLLNRIYSPGLQFSPRPRWRTYFKCEDVRLLLDPTERQTTKAALMRRMSTRKDANEVGHEGSEPTLFD